MSEICLVTMIVATEDPDALMAAVTGTGANVRAVLTAVPAPLGHAMISTYFAEDTSPDEVANLFADAAERFRAPKTE
jgi:hypothetical protein